MTTGPASGHGIGPLSPHARTRLEKAAADNGFDQPIPESGPEPGWLGFASTKCPLWIWLGVETQGRPVLALSQAKVAGALAGQAEASAIVPPLGARAVVSVADIPSLHGVLRRAFQLARTLPNAPLERFAAKTKLLPRVTEAERLVVQRVGQALFRESLLEYWDGRCAVTGLAVAELLRASHIKPWADCETDAERLDVHNGLLLAPHLDAVFDRGFITVADDGAILTASALDAPTRRTLGLDASLRVRALAEGHRALLPWHRERVFRGRRAAGSSSK